MFRALRRAGWALAAAGLGLIAPARTTAAGPPFAAAEQIIEIGPEATGPVMVPNHVLAAADTHFTAMEVELAWLADPLTFPYHLTLHVEGGTVHVRGFVQNKAARERALRLARQHCPLQVLDELKIHPSMVIPTLFPAAPLKPAEAEEVLQEALPGRAAALHVICRPDGVVRVTGKVASLEDKLTVSRRLRTISGCVAVVNELGLPAGPSAAAMPRAGLNRHPQSPRDTTQSVSRPRGQPLPVGNPITSMAPAPEQPVEPWVPVAQAPEDSDQVTPPAPAAAAPVAETPAGPMVPNTGLLAQLKTRVEAICGKAATDIHLVPKSRRDLLIQFSVPDDDTAARLSEKILTIPELARYRVDLDVKVPEIAPTPPREIPVPASSLAPAPPAAVWPEADPAVAATPTTRPSPPAPEAKPRAAVSQASGPPASPPRTGAPASAISVVIPPPPAPPSVVGMDKPKEPLPFIPAPPLPDLPTPPTLTSSLPRPADSKAPLALKPESPAPRKMQPLEDVAALMPEFHKALAKTTPPPAPGPARLQECIERTCGRAAGEVRVQLRSPRNVLVQFKAAGEEEGERLAAKVLAMPELAAYHVDLDVNVADEPVPPPPITTVAWHPAASPVAAARSALKAASASPMTSSQPRDQDNGSAGYVTSGVVVISEPAPPPRRRDPARLPAGLQERLQSVCGSRAEVRAVARSATNLRIELKTRSPAEAERLTNILLNLPELRPFKVDMDVTLVSGE